MTTGSVWECSGNRWKGDRGRPGERSGDGVAVPGVNRTVDGKAPGSRKGACVVREVGPKESWDTPAFRGQPKRRPEQLRVLQLCRGMICIPYNPSIESVQFEHF